MVGKAFHHTILAEKQEPPFIDVEIYDPLLTPEFEDLEDFIESFDTEPFDLAVVCVPTPMTAEGDLDATALMETVTVLGEKAIPTAIKSTVLPNICDLLDSQYPEHVCFIPEFLTEANWKFDVVVERIIVGSSSEKMYDLMCEFYSNFVVRPDREVHWVRPIEASLIKYASNTFLAMKVSFFNQIAQLAQVLNRSYDSEIDLAPIINGITMDERIGISHSQVPGPDGSVGFGGSCFPKDVSALRRMMESHIKLPGDLIKATDDYNRSIRQQEYEGKVEGNVSVADHLLDHPGL